MSIYRATLAPIQGKYLPPADINYAALPDNQQQYNQLPNFVTSDGQPTEVMQNMYTSLGIPQNQSRFSDEQLRELDAKRVATVIKSMLSDD
jgi:predicted naringenin-chalcone synthase